jgi:hypothetical protein
MISQEGQEATQLAHVSPSFGSRLNYIIDFTWGAGFSRIFAET